MNNTRWNVGKTLETIFGAGGQIGYGFSIQNANGAPLLVLSYKDKPAAEEAEALIRKAVELAAEILRP